MPLSLAGKVLKKKWRLGELVGSGACAQVYEVVDTSKTEIGPLVAKVAPLPTGLPPAMSKNKKRKKTDEEKHADMLYYEYTLYNGYLRGHGGVPQVPQGGYGEDQQVRFLIMSRLGPDVEAAQTQNGPWSISRMAGYARQMLSLLRVLHEKCKMVFVDVKPENFMFGLPESPDEEKIFLIDFGLSDRYTTAGGQIKPAKQSAQVAGTPEFLSLNCHAGAGAGRCDDLESLGYVFLAMLRGGSLPWSEATSLKNGLDIKKSTSLEDLCAGLPTQVLQYMQQVRSMSYEDAPDYDALDKLLQGAEKAGGTASAAAKPAKKPTAKPKKAAAGAAVGRRSGARGAGGGASSNRGAAAVASAAASLSDRENSRPTRSQSGKGKPRVEDDASGVESAAPGKRAAGGTAAGVGDHGGENGSGVSSPKAKKAGGVRRRATSPSARVPACQSSVVDADSGRTSVRRGARTRSSPQNEASNKRAHKADNISEDLEEDEEACFHDAREVVDDDDDDEEVVELTEVSRGKATGKGGNARVSPRRTGRSGAAQEGFVLEVTAGPHKGHTLRVEASGSDVRIGRGAPKKSGLRLEDDLEVSHRHAVLRPTAEGLRCEDAGSLNGTFVNESRARAPQLLKAGDVLQVGQSVVRISR